MENHREEVCVKIQKNDESQEKASSEVNLDPGLPAWRAERKEISVIKETWVLGLRHSLLS